MGRRLRLADGALSQSLKQKRAGMPIALDKAPAAIASLPPERRLFNRRNRRKKRLSPTIIAFQNSSGHCRRAGHTNPVGEPFAPRPNRRPRRAGVAALGAPIAPAPLKTQTQCQPPFGAPAFRAHPAARQAKRRPFGAVWSPAPVCHPIRIPSPAGQIGRRNAACPALKPVAALVVAFTQQSVQPLKTAGHFYNCSKQRDNRIITSQICQNTPVYPKFCDLTAQGASSICPLDRDVNRSHYVFMRLRPNPKFLK